MTVPWIINKIMHLKSRPQGYIAAFASHTDPAYSNPPPKLVQQKEEETLLGANLKSFIKERLFGNFINYTKLYNNRKYNFTPTVSTLADLNEQNEYDPMKSSPAIQENYKQRVSELRNNMEKKIHERYNSETEKLSQKPVKYRSGNRSSLGSNIQESAILNSQRSRVNKSGLSNKYSLHGSRVDKNASYDLERYNGSSFISAIEEYEHNKKVQHSGRKERLSPINNKVDLLNKLEKVKNNLSVQSQLRKSPNRIESERYDIIEPTWEIFCQPIKVRALQMSPSEGLAENLPSLQGNRSSISIQKSQFSLGRTYFVKASFIEYLNSPKHTYPPLSNSIFNFFQISSRLYDQLKIEEYKVITEVMVNSGPRVWAIASFRFWDQNQDGVICSKDIFAVYQILDEAQARIKEMPAYELTKGYKFISLLKEVLQDLRSTVIEINFDCEVQKKRRATSQKIFSEDKLQMKYLQEALLRKKELKYSDLILVLGQNIKNNTKDAKKSVIDTAKDLTMKYSSCYRYSFQATDHNQQTREDREHIENLKEQLKKEKMELVVKSMTSQLEKDRILGIDYKTYLQRELFVQVKAIALETFAIKLT